MSQKIILIYLIFFLQVISSCANKDIYGLDQGIEGSVVWLEGNQMPGFGDSRNSEPSEPVSRGIYIYELTNRSELSGEPPIFDNVNAQLITKSSSNKKGKFKISLPEGVYSVLVKEKSGFFANRFDRNGNVNPVRVKKNKFSQVNIIIDYRAAY